MRRKLVFLLFLGISISAFGQRKGIVQDSVKRDSTIHYNEERDSLKKDSVSIKEVEEYSKKSKFTERLFELIFKDDSDKDSEKKREPNHTVGFEPHSDKIIREIIIESNDPFGYSVHDPEKEAHNWAQKWGNALHVRTKNMAVRKFFLFKKGEQLDTILLNETARLLREQSYVRDVLILPRAIEGENDSIDVEVRLLDSWSLIPRVEFGGSKSKFGVLERNFIGLGHRAKFRFGKRFSDGNSAVDAAYTIPNISNSFVDVMLNYQADYDHLYDRYFTIDRHFYSPLTRWAGGIFVQERSLDRPLAAPNIDFEDVRMKIRYQNVWGGYAFRLKGSLAEDWSTNLVFGIRGMLLNYRETPDEVFDPTDYFSDERFLLANVGLVSREFVRDRYIFRDGEIEDVPVGTIYAVTTGIQRKNQTNRLYTGVRAAYGNYYRWGMLSGNLEAGTFFGSGFEESVISLKLNYFSRLWDIGKNWKLRQFVKPQIVMGFNRQDTYLDRLGLNEEPFFRGVHNYEYNDYGRRRRYIDYSNGNISGFESLATGTRKFVIDLQTQAYSPWSILGFRLNPVFSGSLAYLSGKNQTYGGNRFYTSIGLGLIIRNDYLVFDSFQLSFTYYPSMPGEGSHVFRGNGFRTEDFGFQNFRFGEPRPAIYE